VPLIAEVARLNAAIPQPLKFALVGAFNAGLDVVMFVGLVYGLALPPVAANIISYGVAIISSFLLNRFWTFADIEKPVTAKQFAVYAGLNSIGLGISTAVIWLLVGLIGPIPAKIASLAATYVWNYSTSRFIVFRPTPQNG
jgi:putative flippase GtrA